MSTAAQSAINPHGIQFVLGFKGEGPSRKSEVQSVLFDRAAWTPGAARAWLAAHGFAAPAVDETERHLRYRQHSPGQFEDFRTVKGNPPQQMTYQFAHAASTDAGNRHMRKAGRAVWDESDYEAAAAEFERIWPHQNPFGISSAITYAAQSGLMDAVLGPGRKRNITDRAHRYRATAHPPAGPRRCAFCGGKRNVEVGHVNGHEEDGSAENLIWTCRSCNVLAANGLRAAGMGRKTRQMHPAGGATSVGQWLTAVMSMKGQSDAMTVPAAVAMIRATSAAKRSEFASEIWSKRHERARYRNPRGSLRLSLCPQAAAEHSASIRQYAHSFHHPGVICICQEFYELPERHQLAILLHEIGHLLCGDGRHVERDANHVVFDAFGILLSSEDTEYGNHLETLSDEGVRRAREVFGIPNSSRNPSIRIEMAVIASIAHDELRWAKEDHPNWTAKELINYAHRRVPEWYSEYVAEDSANGQRPIVSADVAKRHWLDTFTKEVFG